MKPSHELRKLANVLRLSRRVIFYHGTSSDQLRSILKNGLIPNPSTSHQRGNLKWQYEGISLDPYGGVYMASNINTAKHYAKHSAEKSGTKPIIVEITYETRSSNTLIDEDTVNRAVSYYLDWAGPYDVADFFGFNLNEDSYENYVGFAEKLDQSKDMFEYIAENIVETLFMERDIPLDSKNYRIRKPKLIGLMQNVIVSQGLHILENSWALDETSKPEVLRNTFERLRQDVTDFSKEAKALNTQPEGWEEYEGGDETHNLRVVEPIGFSGKNRILAIYELIHNDNMEKIYPR